ncbi:UDP-N-acetylmuramoyl-L-alanine--D-glutamate ligase [Blautia wexlerae]|uniref:UDP-N-acetylmuramoyl-L-alanine--D-glutamate ligase n=1 Tax=Blautia wexlerae TaxID=418240 RepID=UPI0004127659|nr:UDP-N-acetylmuramoyl-L-alanine--D-glutamate ligase [Blautia wexlerae]
MELQGKKVLVFGSGKSGIGASDLLAKVGAFPVIYDGNAETDKDAVVHKTDGTYPVAVYAGELPKEVQDSLDLVVLSPGVPTDLPLVKSFYEQGLPVWGEVELAYRVGDGEVLAITGTNGKTTTTALLGKIMQDARESVFVVGNIGTPYTSKALEMKPNSVTVAEISSFQLETIDEFAPKVSAILNITEDHLNRHHTMEEYIRVKELITENQGTEDVCVLNYEDEVLREFGKHLTPRVVYFSSGRKLDEGIYLDGNKIILKDGEKEIEVVKTEDLKLLGKHNFENVMAAVAMAYYDGVSMDSIRKSICEFTAVAHRIEYVTEKKGVVYYNDSKGTNPDAAIKGIQAMNRPTLLIGGGYDKQSGYDEWIEAFDGKVRYLVLIGQTKEKIKEAAEKHGFHDIILCEDLKEAVKVCEEKAQPGDAVLLSPACASWGQFDNYEQRGDMFKEYVRNL